MQIVYGHRKSAIDHPSAHNLRTSFNSMIMFHTINVNNVVYKGPELMTEEIEKGGINIFRTIYVSLSL